MKVSTMRTFARASLFGATALAGGALYVGAGPMVAAIYAAAVGLINAAVLYEKASQKEKAGKACGLSSGPPPPPMHSKRLAPIEERLRTAEVILPQDAFDAAKHPARIVAGGKSSEDRPAHHVGRIDSVADAVAFIGGYNPHNCAQTARARLYGLAEAPPTARQVEIVGEVLRGIREDLISGGLPKARKGREGPPKDW